MGFLEVLTVIFVVLKLFNIIDWSWWLVFSPFLLSLVLYIIFFTLGISVFKSKSDKMKKMR